MVIYFIMQSSFEKISKNSPCFPSKRGNLQSAILFMLSTAAAIITQKKKKKKNPYEISAMSIHAIVKLNFSHLSLCLHNASPQRHQMTSHYALPLLTSLAHYITLLQIKIGMRSFCGQLTCALFYHTNKHHICDTPLLCRYVVSLHYKKA